MEAKENGRSPGRDRKAGRRDRKARSGGISRPERDPIQAGLLEAQRFIGSSGMTRVMIPSDGYILHLKRNTSWIRNTHTQPAVEHQCAVIDSVTACNRRTGGSRSRRVGRGWRNRRCIRWGW